MDFLVNDCISIQSYSQSNNWVFTIYKHIPMYLVMSFMLMLKMGRLSLLSTVERSPDL